MTDSQHVRQVIAPRFGDPGVLELREVELPSPLAGQVTIEVRAAGVNPADYKRFAAGDPAALPHHPGFEVAGVISAIGPGTRIASGDVAIGDPVLAFRISGGYASAVTVPAKDVFAKPDSLTDPEAANLLLAGTTALDMLRVTHAAEGETILVHGASGAVGVMVLQLARLRGVRAIGTTSDARAEVVRGFGGEPVAYGPGLEQRVRALASGGIDAALDCVGTGEAADVSLALTDLDRIVTVADPIRAEQAGYRLIHGAQPDSIAFRDSVRGELIGLAASGQLKVPVATTYSLDRAVDALDMLKQGHPGGKLALIP